MSTDRTPRYVPSTIYCKGATVPVLRVIAHPPGTAKGAHIVPHLTAVELVTERGSRWFGFENAQINSELRMIVSGFDGRDEVRSKWEVCKRDCGSSNSTSPSRDNLTVMLVAYIKAALFSSSDESGHPLDKSYGFDDIDSKTLAKMRADVHGFGREYHAAIEPVPRSDASAWIQAGHESLAHPERTRRRFLGRRLARACCDHPRRGRQ